MMIRGTLTGLVVSLLAASGVLAGDASSSADSAKEVLRKSREAIKQTKVVRYHADYKATGYVTRWVKDLRGSVIVGEKAKYDVPRFLLDLTMPGSEGSDPMKYTVGCDGDVYFLVDESTKTVYADLDPAVLGSNSRAFRRVILPEFGDDEAFKTELEAEQIELKDAESVAGEDCHVVFIKNESPPDVTWWISKDDHLPRRVRRLYKQPDEGEGTTELTLSSLVADPPMKEDPFRVRVPEGFKKTDKFAP